MSTSSAIPEHLLRHAAGTAEVATSLARAHATLEAAQAALAATHPDPSLLGPLPPGGDALRRVTALLFDLAAYTGRTGRAFLAADTGRWPLPTLATAPVTVPDAALLAPRGAAAAAAPLLRELRTADPRERRAVLECVPADLLAALLRADPAFLGNTPGIPEPVRYQANRRRVLADLRRAFATLSFHTAARLATLLQGPGGHPAQILLYDPAAHHVATVLGDLATAARVAVLVPGCGTTVDTFSGDTAARARNLFQATQARSQKGVAVIAWLGYDAPPFVRGGFVDPARAGARNLAALLSTLGRAPGSTLTLVGHSYGSVVVGETLAHHPTAAGTVDDAVVLGSPGMGVDHASALRLAPGGRVYAEDIRGDPVGHLEAFGTAPTSGAFGGVRLTTNAPGHVVVGGGVDLHAHSQYFTPGSEALANTALVVAGRAGEAQRQARTDGERLADAERQLDPALHPLDGPLDAATRHYHGPGHQVLEGADRLARTERAAEHTAVRLAVDEGEDLVESGVEVVVKVFG